MAEVHRAGWHRRRQELWPICGQRFAVVTTCEPGAVTCKRCSYITDHGTLGMFRIAHLEDARRVDRA